MKDDFSKELVDSLIEDKKSERKLKIITRISILVIFVVLIFSSFLFSTENNIYSQQHTAIIKIDGFISPAEETNTENIISLVSKAMRNDYCNNIILKINSSGGSATQSKIIFDEINKLKAINNKKIFSVIEDVGASGGYYIAASGDKIFSSPSSIVGSIGVRLDSINIRALMDKLGIRSQTLFSGEDKGILDPFADMTEKHKIHLKKLLVNIHQDFIKDVKESRKDLINNDIVFTGLFWTGNEAIKLGLIDEIASIYDVNTKYFNNDHMITYNKESTYIERILKSTINLINNNTMSLIH